VSKLLFDCLLLLFGFGLILATGFGAALVGVAGTPLNQDSCRLKYFY
jgi:hypothetical protein